MLRPVVLLFAGLWALSQYTFAQSDAASTGWMELVKGSRDDAMGAEVREAFGALLPPDSLNTIFQAADEEKFMADLYGISTALLHELGVSEVSGGRHCTHCDAQRFYSYRRDGVCGSRA